VEYLRTFFVFDFFACMPGLLSAETVLWLYPFKVLRIIRLQRLHAFLNKLSVLLKERYMMY
jgi:hypothetical protein